MGLENSFSRIKKSEFFAILVPGVYVVSTLFLASLAWVHRDNPTAWWRQILDVAEHHSRDWPLPAAAVFFAYLVGCIFRALPTSNMDDLCGSFFKWTARGDYEKILYSENFPYCPMLKYVQTKLKENTAPFPIRLPKRENEHTVFNYWKATLCQLAPQSFVYT